MRPRADTKANTLHPRDQEDASLTIDTAKTRDDSIPMRTRRELSITQDECTRCSSRGERLM